MKLALIGATGRTGRLVLGEAARRGHQVSVLVRDPTRLDGAGPAPARVVAGDGTDVDAVADVLAGQDAIVVMVSSRGTQQPVTRGVARAVVAAAAAKGVARAVFTSTYGMVATRPLLVAPVLRRVFAAAFSEQALADEVVRSSALDWTILRATRLTDRPETGLVQMTAEPLRSGPFSLPRADLADSLLAVVTENQGIRTIFNITGGRR